MVQKSFWPNDQVRHVCSFGQLKEINQYSTFKLRHKQIGWWHAKIGNEVTLAVLTIVWKFWWVVTDKNIYPLSSRCNCSAGTVWTANWQTSTLVCQIAEQALRSACSQVVEIPWCYLQIHRDGILDLDKLVDILPFNLQPLSRKM